MPTDLNIKQFYQHVQKIQKLIISTNFFIRNIHPDPIYM
jgi:hypothetical protein